MNGFKTILDNGSEESRNRLSPSSGIDSTTILKTLIGKLTAQNEESEDIEARIANLSRLPPKYYGQKLHALLSGAERRLPATVIESCFKSDETIVSAFV